MLFSPDSLQWPVPPKGFLNWRDSPDVEPEEAVVDRYKRCVDGEFPVNNEALLEPSQSSGESVWEKFESLVNKKLSTVDFKVEFSEFLFKLTGAKHDYYPTDLPELFITFIKTEPNRKGVLDFVEHFGVLGLSESYYSGERLSAWVTEIVCLRHAYRLWCALKSQNTDALADLHRLRVQRSQDIAERFKADDAMRRLDPEGWQSMIHWPSEVAALPLETVAWREIRKVTNDALQQHGLVLECALKSDASGLITSFAPKTLIATLWLQFLELTIEEHWKVCDYCGKPFKAKSNKRRYCTSSHNQLAYLKRKKSKK